MGLIQYFVRLQFYATVIQPPPFPPVHFPTAAIILRHRHPFIKKRSRFSNDRFMPPPPISKRKLKPKIEMSTIFFLNL